MDTDTPPHTLNKSTNKRNLILPTPSAPKRFVVEEGNSVVHCEIHSTPYNKSVDNTPGKQTVIDTNSGGINRMERIEASTLRSSISSIRPKRFAFNTPLRRDSSTGSIQDSEVPPLKNELSLKDMKLSEYLKKNPEMFPLNKGCKYRFKMIHLYVFIIVFFTVFFICSPKSAKKATAYLSMIITSTSEVPEPGRSLMYSLLLFIHQIFAVPLQTVSIGLICFATSSFLYGYIMVIIVNLSSAIILFLAVRKTCSKYINEKFKDNAFVQVIKAESAIYPKKMSMLFRFMNIPGFYKNIALSLSSISFWTYLFPAILEIILSNVLICFTGYALKTGAKSVTYKSKKPPEKALLIFSYIMAAIQIGSFILAALITLTKIRKIRYLQKMIAIEKEKDKRKDKGYIHDMNQEDEINIDDDKTDHLIVEVYNYSKNKNNKSMNKLPTIKEVDDINIQDTMAARKIKNNDRLQNDEKRRRNSLDLSTSETQTACNPRRRSSFLDLISLTFRERITSPEKIQVKTKVNNLISMCAENDQSIELDDNRQHNEDE